MNVDMMTMTPEQAATMLIDKHQGNFRSAESAAWKLWERHAGGSCLQRPNADSHEALYSQAIIRSILYRPGGHLHEVA